MSCTFRTFAEAHSPDKDCAVKLMGTLHFGVFACTPPWIRCLNSFTSICTCRHVPEGEYTIVGKLDKNEFVPYDEKLKKKLSEEGEIKV